MSEREKTNMAGQLTGKVALVTGAASGIGRACAGRVGGPGGTVVVADLQEAAGQETVHAISAAGGQAEFLRLDVTDEESWTGAVEAIRARRGRLDILVNNAGIAISVPTLEM